MRSSKLQRSIQILLFSFLAIAGLYYAKPFLVPLCFGGLFAMLFLPLSRWLEARGISKGLSILLCVLLFILVIGGMISLVAWQVTDLTSDLTNIEQKVTGAIEQTKDYVNKTFGITKQQQDEIIQKQSEQSSGIITGMGSYLMSVVVDFILVLVYIFLLMYYRDHIRKFILKLIPPRSGEKRTADEILHDIQKVTQQYLTGLGLMIVCLWIMYSIGFSLVGLNNFFFFAILCGLLEIVPFVGNLTGNLLAILMALTQGGGLSMVIGILVVYALVQFIQTYLLEPLVVGAEVNINPLFTILILVLGELVWGIPGMVLAIPLLGIVKIICDHIEPLKPYGFLIGSGKQKKMNFAQKIKKLAGKGD